jgi:DNA-directed RNA polymerase subunit RPC12/RpoP
MATLCKNCATPLLFDPTKQKVVCPACGGAWDAEEVESTEKKYQEGKEAISAAEIYGVDPSTAQEYFDCYIYTCGSCGGEISINGTEASTRCIYCGSSSVVFNRISKEKAPEFIIPFSISKEQAVNLVKNRFKHGVFIPKEVKNFSPSEVRGIYVPYWIANAYHVEAAVFSGEVKSGKHTVTKYWERSGKMSIDNLPVDGSQMLSDESSQRLEPYDFSGLKLFDEDYLLGFYSNVSDISNADLQEVVTLRAREAFNEKAAKTFHASNKKVQMERSSTLIDRDVRYAMLPVWFVCYEFEGKHNTIMVNGQTGKVVCGIPWNKKLFTGCVAGLSVLFTTFLTWFFGNSFLPALFTSYTSSRRHRTSSSSNNNPVSVIIAGFMIAAAVFFVGYAVYKKVVKQLELTQSKSIFNFMKKRQG